MKVVGVQTCGAGVPVASGARAQRLGVIQTHVHCVTDLRREYAVSPVSKNFELHVATFALHCTVISKPGLKSDGSPVDKNVPSLHPRATLDFSNLCISTISFVGKLHVSEFLKCVTMIQLVLHCIYLNHGLSAPRATKLQASALDATENYTLR